MFQVERYKNWYALFVVTGKEKLVQNLLYKLISKEDIEKYNLIFMVTELEELKKRNSSWEVSVTTLLQGYILIGGNEIDDYIYNKIKSMPKVLNFVKTDKYISKIPHEEIRVLGDWCNDDGIIEHSIIDFDENDKIFVAKGPLKGREGCIKRINKHKRKVLIETELNNKTIKFKLSFEFLRKINNI